MISSCSTLRLNGAPTTTNTTRLNVYMPTTSKISEGNQIYLDMTLNYVRTGKAEHSLHVTKKAAKDCKHALTAMDGRNNNSTHWSTRHSHAKNPNASRDSNAHSTTVQR